ncbi:hypothetical protein [Candidatus Protochlamydia phocaeensis]|uniref:hypothetical protein n=1 Tax=Candidatus Protochlamydia phocaeensis TaxID=1414722 RepID=UPI0008399591|nr:hypothetical protein [Candidatus Protochlamydia phocaeensis]
MSYFPHFSSQDLFSLHPSSLFSLLSNSQEIPCLIESVFQKELGALQNPDWTLQERLLKLEERLTELNPCRNSYTLQARLQILDSKIYEISAFYFQFVRNECDPLIIKEDNLPISLYLKKYDFIYLTAEYKNQIMPFARFRISKEGIIHYFNYPSPIGLSPSTQRAEQEIIKPLRHFLDISENVLVQSISEFTNSLSNPSVDFEDRMQRLKEGMTFVENLQIKAGPKRWWQTWIEFSFPEKNSFYLNLFLTEDKYDSNALDESLVEIESKHDFDYTDSSLDIEAFKTKKYYFLKGFDERDEDLKTPVFVCRIDKEGEIAELVHIQSIEGHLSGTEFKDIFFTPLQDYLSPEKSYLWDAAKIEVDLPEKQMRKLKLRYLRCGTSWYEKIGYRPVTCKNWLSCHGIKITQNIHYYYAAVEKIKATTLFHLYRDILKGYSAQQKVLLNLYQKYLPQTRLEEYTIECLTNAIISHAKSQTDIKLRQQANKDLVYVYDYFLSSFTLKSKSSKAQILYNLALQMIKTTRLWVKQTSSLMGSNQSLSYQEFIQQPHLPFDSIVAEQMRFKAIINLQDLEW